MSPPTQDGENLRFTLAPGSKAALDEDKPYWTQGVTAFETDERTQKRREVEAKRVAAKKTRREEASRGGACPEGVAHGFAPNLEV